LLAAVGRAPLRRVGRAALLAVAGTGLTAVFLLPNFAYGRDTVVSQSANTEPFLRNLADFSATSIVLSPFPVVPDGRTTTDLYTQVSLMALVWALSAVVATRSWRALMPLALGAAILVLVVHPSWWLDFPTIVQSVQFTFRLVPYAMFAVCVAIALVLRERRDRAMAVTLGVVVAFQAGVGTWQALHARARGLPGVIPLKHGDIHPGIPPTSFVGPGLAQPGQFKLVDGVLSPRPAEEVKAPDRIVDPPIIITITGPRPAGGLVATNVVASPMVRVRGEARISAKDDSGYFVLAVPPGEGPFTATFEAKPTRWVWLGRAISAGSAILLAVLAGLALRRRRRTAYASSP
jgi:hypothetical protein